MPIEQVVTGSLAAWPRNRTTMEDLTEDFSRMVFDVGLVVSVGMDVPYLISVITPISREVFSWEAAERRADWEESHGCFVEFSDVKDLLSNLHS